MWPTGGWMGRRQLVINLAAPCIIHSIIHTATTNTAYTTTDQHRIQYKCTIVWCYVNCTWINTIQYNVKMDLNFGHLEGVVLHNTWTYYLTLGVSVELQLREVPVKTKYQLQKELLCQGLLCEATEDTKDTRQMSIRARQIGLRVQMRFQAN